MKHFFLIVTMLSLAVSAGAATSCPDTTNYQLVNGVCVPARTGLPDPSGGIAAVISNLLSWLLGIFGMIGVIAFIISGLYYLTAAGSAEQEKTAKKAMQMSILGVVVGLMGYVIIQAVDIALRGTDRIF